VDEQELIQFIPELRGRPLTVSALGGGLTNRNYRIDADTQSYVLRVAGKNTALLGINRMCEVACSRAAAALEVGPEVIAYLPEHEAMVRRFVSGCVLTAEDVQQPDVLRRVTKTLRRYHGGPPGEGAFSPFVTVRCYHALAQERQVSFPDNLEGALERLAKIEQELQTDDPPCPCHNDLLAGNFIDDGTTVRIIDWEYGGMGDRFFDLGNLAVNNEFADEHERALLALYFGEVRPDHLQRLRLMRLASDMREAMWGFLQAALSTLDIDYLAYGRRHLERFINSPGAAEVGPDSAR
jgi:thiamine kinase-like enzyme